MRAVIQRVLSASLSVSGSLVSSIDKGLVVYLGVGKGDSEADCVYFAKKIANMRIFEDANNKMNLSALSEGNEVLLVSQFTLYADVSGGNRPGFSDAEAPARANELYERAAAELSALGVTVKKGVFGADMIITQVNDGPVTIIMNSPEAAGKKQ